MQRFFTAVLFTALLMGVAAHAGQVRVGFIPKAMDSEFWLAVKNGAEAAAKENPDIDLIILSPDSETNVQRQIQIIDDMLIQGIDVLCVAPSGAKEVAPALQKAHDEGVPVVVFDSDAPDFKDRVAFVGTDNFIGSALAADFIIERLGGKGKVAIMMGVMGHQTARERLEGAEKKFTETPGIELVAKQTANWSRSEGMNVMEDMLSANPGLDAVFCCNDNMAMGAAEAILADRAKTFIVGFDANDEAVRAVTDPNNPIAATVAQSSFNIGKFAVETAYKHVKGEKVPNHVDTGTDLVTVENAAKYLK